MPKILKQLILLTPLIAIVFFISFELNTKSSLELPVITTASQIEQLFPKNAKDIIKLERETINKASANIKAIIKIKNKNRTFENTVLAFDRTMAQFSITQAILQVLSLLSPDEQIREQSHESTLKLQQFYIDNITQNNKLFDALNEYSALAKERNEVLTEPQKYLLEETLKDYKRSGINLPLPKQKKLNELQKLLTKHELNFEKNIASDNGTVEVTREELAGTDQHFIENLKKAKDGKYILGIDSPTVTIILDDCNVESTRKKLWERFIKRAFPANAHELNEIIRLRSEIAAILNYSSYAELDIDNQMAKNPKIVKEFLLSLVKKVEDKTKKEIDLLKQNLPKNINLIDGKFKQWDMSYVKNQNKKRMQIDESKIAQYFPIDYTLPALLGIYEKIFSITFKNDLKITNLWHNDVIGLSVFKDDKFIGSILLDIYPRENKYSHAAALAIVPAVKTSKKAIPALILVIANFPKATATGRPALLKRTDVITFFHEFGHALHNLLGATEYASQSGTHVKGDFVEMPSQMLEQWMWEPTILKMVSSHYETKKPLSDDIINRIVKMKNFDSGDRAQGQVCLALASLEFYNNNQDPNIVNIWKNLHQIYRPHVKFDDANHRYCSFVHLTSYGAKYYGYLWSEVFALDLFNQFKKHGLLNPEIGERYVKEVIGKGGSDDPENLLFNFLGRKPNDEAFFQNLGV